MSQMKKYNLFLLFLLIVSTLFLSCSKEDLFQDQSMLDLQSPYGHWQLHGFGVQEGREVEKLLNKSDSYLLTLKRDGTFTATSNEETFSGRINVNTGRRNIRIEIESDSNIFAGSKENRLYSERLLGVKNYSVEYNNKEKTKFLYLYYSDDKKQYLLYKQILPQ